MAPTHINASGGINLTIYTTSTDYRKIWESHNGPIPLDTDGRTYEIHHIDGDRTNNDISNLACLSIQEHYDIHYRQEDWKACQALAMRMDVDPEIKSELARKSAKQLVEYGDHPWQRKADGTSLVMTTNKVRIENGTHAFLKRSDGSSVGLERSLERVQNGTHQMLKRNDGSSIGGAANLKRIEEKTHNLLKRSDGTSLGQEVARKRVENGTHHWLHAKSKGLHPTQIKVSCLACRKELAVSHFWQHHGERCKVLQNRDPNGS